MNRPETSEFAPYYNTYISRVSGDVLGVLEGQIPKLQEMLSALPEERGSYLYAEGKWTIKEILSHLIDGERIFVYRVLRISRGDTTPLEGFEQDGYIELSNANNRTFADLLEEIDLQRRSNILLLRNISDADSRRTGLASGNPVSVRALAYVMAGHVIHHTDILRDRYLA